LALHDAMIAARPLLLLPALVVGVYNETLATQYATLAGAAYCPADTLSDWSCGKKCFKGITDVKLCNGTAASSYVGLWHGKCLAVFEGTHDMESTATDLWMKSHKFHCDGCGDCPGCKVHAGFDDEWTSQEQCIKSSLAAIGCSPDKPLHATGHSLGAAVVAIGMLKLKMAGWNVVELYNFGMPRVMSPVLAARFNELFKEQFFRVTHGIDPFIDMPPDPTGHFYEHVEPEVYYNSSVREGYIVCNGPYNTTCSAQHFPDWEDYIHPKNLAYHHNYMDVDTTEHGCEVHAVSCDDDIPYSWCSYGISCNNDTRGPSHCNYGPMSKMFVGKCHCDAGYCPNTTGSCVPKQVGFAADVRNSVQIV